MLPTQHKTAHNVH